jgi:Multiprotein bridging factor 1
MPTGTSIPFSQDFDSVNVGRGAGAGSTKPKTARAVDAAKASGLISTEKRHGAGGNASAHSAGIMSARKVSSSSSSGGGKVWCVCVCVGILH